MKHSRFRSRSGVRGGRPHPRVQRWRRRPTWVSNSRSTSAAWRTVSSVVLNADTGVVETVMVAGRVVKRGGQLLHHDAAAALTALTETASAVAGA
ncbi:hypothetical protein B0I32_103148 [Nonomuraea fuscirosea]|uniref:Uncharacterized protein n=1 Tax=Nonomuraea fuscirosea TaxID=1291556 RepID=A0A2T0N6L1_9ACTN|nr:hypothetical protein B0I32_103148 [Nonomuraea fuscirosea]